MAKKPVKHVADAIRDRRKELGLSFYQVAKQAGISNQNTVKQIEAGENVKIHTVQAVCTVLGLNLEAVDTQ